MSARGATLTPSSNGTRSAPALALHGVQAGYHRATVLRDVDLEVRPGSVLALLGPNGAGKTTLLRAAAGLIATSAGTVHIAGEDATRWAPHRRARRGLCLIPEGRGVFPGLTVAENLVAQTPAWAQDEGSREQALEAFPALKSRMGQMAGSMSGGEQQMLALCRAWTSEPQLVLLDEVSLGLAPKIVDVIFAALRGLADAGRAILIVEQYVTRALALADHVCLLEKGAVAFSGEPSALDQGTLLQRYLGMTSVTAT